MSTIISIFQIKELPDLNSQKYVSIYGQGVRSKVLANQTKFLLMLTDIAQSTNLTFSLRYLYLPNLEFDQRLKIFLVFSQSAEQSSANQDFFNNNQDKIITGFLSQFYELVSLTDEVKKEYDDFLSSPSIQFIGEAIKDVKEIQTFADTKKIYTAPLPWEADDSNDMSVVCEAITSFNSSSLLEITLQPYTNDQERQELVNSINRTMNALKQLSNPGWTVGKQDEENEDDATARIFQRIYEKYSSFMLGQLYKYTFRVAGTTELQVNYILTTFLLSGTKKSPYKTIILPENDFTKNIDLIKTLQISQTDSWNLYEQQDEQQMSTENAVELLRRLASFDEINSLFRFAVPGNAPIKGIKQENSIKIEKPEDSIDFGGHEINSIETKIRIKLEQLNKHAFICGVPGSGKTTTSFNLLTQLCLKDIPFLVFESAKTEYRSLLKLQALPQSSDKDLNEDLNEDQIKERIKRIEEEIDKLTSLTNNLRIYTLGNEQISPFRFNPFEVSEGVPFYEHISNLEACFRGALPLFGPLPALLSEALEEIYYDLDWTSNEVGTPEDKKIPTMKDLYAKISDLLESKDYVGEVKSNIKTALEVRIGSLVRRAIGSILNTTKSSPTIADLLEHPTILELDYLNQDQANLMTFFLLTKIREYLKRKPIPEPVKPQHVILLEEAHNIVGRNTGNTSAEEVNTKTEAANYITRMLAEMRALKEAIIIIDQLPTAVAAEVIKNTNLKIAHRLVSDEDRQDIGGSMLLNKSQMEEIARLNPGQSFVYIEGWYRPALVNIPRENSAKVRFKVENSYTDKDLLKLIENKHWYITQKTILKEITESQCEAIYQECVNILANIGKHKEQLTNFRKTLIKDLYNLRDELFYGLAYYLNFKKNQSLDRPEKDDIVVVSHFKIDAFFGFSLTSEGEKLTGSDWLDLKSKMLNQVGDIEKQLQMLKNSQSKVSDFQQNSKYQSLKRQLFSAQTYLNQLDDKEYEVKKDLQNLEKINEAVQKLLLSLNNIIVFRIMKNTITNQNNQ
jgi:hypothetical protein